MAQTITPVIDSPVFQLCQSCGYENAPHVRSNGICARCESFDTWEILTGRNRLFWDSVREDEIDETLGFLRESLSESRRIRDAHDPRSLLFRVAR
jgi:hypothetical protein